MKCIIYTDGGCHGNPGPGGWACIVLDEGKLPLGEERGGEKVTTNNRMELLAVINGLAKAKEMGADKITLHTDSQYVQKGISEWIKNGKKNGWKTASKQPVKNKDLWLILDQAAAAYAAAGSPIEWLWVKGHAGNRWNERCDQLVQDAIAEVK
jgi:ribonuclease HI